MCTNSYLLSGWQTTSQLHSCYLVCIFFQPGTVAANSLASKKFREQVFQHTGYEVLSCTQVAVRNNEPSAQPKFPQKTPRVTAISKWVIIKIIKASRMDELDKNTIKQETEIQCMHIPIFLRKGVYLVIFSSKFLGLKRFKKKYGRVRS